VRLPLEGQTGGRPNGGEWGGPTGPECRKRRKEECGIRCGMGNLPLPRGEFVAFIFLNPTIFLKDQ
jgi:hypothetical protein